ncbi:uncharacterized protein [Dysidea avara]|uniref:uncharacterized protein n=1 Tax=Dysidea avara TaxID=196820 RepID=UPI0033194676
MLKTALVILFVMSCGCPAESRCAAPTLDADDIFYTAMDNYYSVVNASGMLVGCMPNIVSEGPGASMIVATPEWRANIRLIVSYGTCTPEHRGYMCVVNWGDGSEQAYEHFDSLTPYHMEHQYDHQDRQYVVHAMYCSTSGPAQTTAAVICDHCILSIQTSYDPSRPLDL